MKWILARLLASLEFCIPTSIETARRLGEGIRIRVPTPYPKPSPQRLCRITTSTIKNPPAISFAELAEMTTPTIVIIANDEKAGRYSTADFVNLGNKRLMMKPITMGRITTHKILRNIFSTFSTSTCMSMRSINGPLILFIYRVI